MAGSPCRPCATSKRTSEGRRPRHSRPHSPILQITRNYQSRSRQAGSPFLYLSLCCSRPRPWPILKCLPVASIREPDTVLGHALKSPRYSHARINGEEDPLSLDSPRLAGKKAEVMKRRRRKGEKKKEGKEEGKRTEEEMTEKGADQWVMRTG